MKQQILNEKKITSIGDKHNRGINDKSLKVLANSIYETLRAEGCEHRDIIGVSSQLIGLVTQAMDPNKTYKS